MEKADILEMTVKHLKNVQHQEQRGTKAQTLSAAANRYRAGFTECAQEVRRYLASVEGVSPTVHERLISHLETIARRTTVTNSVSSNGNIQPKLEAATTNASPQQHISAATPIVNISNDGAIPVGKLPIAALRTGTGGDVTVTNAGGTVSLNYVTSNGHLPVLPLLSNNNPTTIINSNAGTSLPAVQTLTLNGTRVVLAPQQVTMPTTVTLITQGNQCSESQVASEISNGTAIPLYINTERVQGSLPGTDHHHSPGASDGESGGSVSPGSTTSSSSSNSHHWVAPPPAEQSLEHPLPIKILPESPFFGSVWRPW